jgi:Flp pilus assembly protein TadD
MFEREVLAGADAMRVPSGRGASRAAAHFLSLRSSRPPGSRPSLRRPGFGLICGALTPDVPGELAQAAGQARRERDAMGRLDAIARAHPSAVPVRVALSRLQASSGDVDRALQTANDACAILPIQERALEQLASIYSDQGAGQDLAAVASRLRQLFPESRAASYYSAAAEFLRGDLPAAERHISRAITIDGGYAAAHNLRGAILASEGQGADARASFRAALHLDPHDPVTYKNLAELELSSGAREVAAGLIAESLSLDPQSESARELLERARSIK